MSCLLGACPETIEISAVKSQICIIGGGFYGLYLAYVLGRNGHAVDLFESSDQLMARASYNNQARVHNGYHYPRSVLTAMRSRMSFPRFVKDFPDCIDSDFEQCYCVGRPLSKVTARQFMRFCLRIGAEIEEAPPRLQRLANARHVEACFSVREYAFDAVRLKRAMLDRLADLPVAVHMGCEALRVEKTDAGIALHCRKKGRETEEDMVRLARHVFNCTYSRINQVTVASRLPLVPLKHEMTEMCLVRVPDEFRNLGITVMCGPFFSVMPFPAVVRDGDVVHSFSHVRYTPHFEWHDDPARPYEDARARMERTRRFTAWTPMVKDAARYFPGLAECERLDSLWEVKTVLPSSEVDDSRPILCKFNHGMEGYHCIMGGKIDNVYDMEKAISDHLGLLQ